MTLRRARSFEDPNDVDPEPDAPDLRMRNNRLMVQREYWPDAFMHYHLVRSVYYTYYREH